VTGPSFRFRLERVRVVRERREKLAKQELARSITRLQSSEAELRSAESDVAQAHAHQRDAATAGTMAGGELLNHQAFLERVEATQRLRALELQRTEAEVAECGASLASAASEHEMLKRLRDRRRGEHELEAARRESNVLDEIATVRYRRRTA
jgi:flagellar export protein FliJ